MQRVVILGGGGLAREVLDVFRACNEVTERYEVVGFIDENPESKGKVLSGVPVLGGFDALDGMGSSDLYAIAGVGSPVTRRKLVTKAVRQGLRFCNVFHPTAVLTEYIQWGVGVVVTAGCIFTNHIRVGNHSFVNLDCTVGHDAVIEDYCNINPGVHVSGNVTLEQGCEIGTGAVIIQGVRIGYWSVIGAGAVVSRDLPCNVTAVGVPARVIKTREDGWHR